MRYILIKTRVLMGTPKNNTLSLLVLTRTGWVPWSEVEGKTNCTDPDLCPVLSFTHRGEAEFVITNDPLAVVVPVDVGNPMYIKGVGDV